MKTMVLGDVHGAHRALMQCFERSGFDPAADRLIFLGDAVDGWSESPGCVEELMRVRNLIYLLGNHDIWLIEWLLYDARPAVWLQQGGAATMAAYGKPEWQERRAEHLSFLTSARLYHVDEANRLFVHGGIEPGVPMGRQDERLMVWDRRLFDRDSGIPDFREVFIGHSPTVIEGTSRPVNFGGSDNIWRLDTGAGWNGRLTIMEVESKQYWQSDLVPDLYPEESGRM